MIIEANEDFSLNIKEMYSGSIETKEGYKFGLALRDIGIDIVAEDGTLYHIDPTGLTINNVRIR